MRNLSLYIVLVLIFLGLSKSFSISSKGTQYIYNEQVYPSFFVRSPVSVILAERIETGFLIKTYYHRYLVIEGVNPPKYVTVRTSIKHYEAYEDKVGLSVFRRSERGSSEEITPLPPGSLYIGNPTYGSWERRKDSNERTWEFHRAYKSFPRHFAWGDFKPTFTFYEKILESKKYQKTFLGLEEEFGSKGSVSLKFFNRSKDKFGKPGEDIKTLFNKLLSAPPWSISKTEQGKNE